MKISWLKNLVFVATLLTSIAVFGSYADVYGHSYSASPDYITQIGKILGEGCVVLDLPITNSQGTVFSRIDYIGDNPNSVCEIDECITTLVLPTNSVTFCSWALCNSKLEKLIFRNKCSLPSYFPSGALIGMFNLKELWFDFDGPITHGEYMQNLINAGAFSYADTIYYRASLSNTVGKVLRNIYGGNRVCYSGTWDNAKIISVNDETAGYIDPPTVVTNYVFSTVTNHIYHHDVVTDMTAYHTTVTNVYVHYLSENAQPTFVFPSSYDTGFINVVAEVEGGFAVIPATWTVNYPGFTEKYGSDFSKALNKPNGKYDRHGNPMFVWQDYVAGTSPMDVNDVFDATIAIEGGKVVVSHTPVLDEERAALRKYTVYGKKNLMDSEWKEVEPGEELDYNFYRVTVRMK